MFFAAKSVKRRLIVFGKIGVKAHPFMAPRVAKLQFASMKRLTMKAKTVPAARINVIAYERMIDIRHMHADLMSTPGLKPDLEQGHIAIAFKDSIVGDCFPTVGNHRHTLPVGTVPADGCRNSAAINRKIAKTKGNICALNAVRFELLGKKAVGKIIFCDDQKPGGILVNAVNDPGSKLASNAGHRSRPIVMV